MDKQTHDTLTAQTEILKALAHPTRLFIAQELRNGERCVCELTTLVGADISTVSRHLSVLRHAGIVSTEKHGNQVLCSLKVPCVLNFLECVQVVLDSNAREQIELRTTN